MSKILLRLPTILITSTILLVVSGIYFYSHYLLMASNTGDKSFSIYRKADDVQLSTLNGPEQTKTPAQPRDLLVYSNKQLGVSFRYPPRLGNVSVEIYPGETGQSFRGRFSSGFLDFGGDSHNYTAGRETSRFDSRGYPAGYSRGSYYFSEAGEVIFPTRCEAFVRKIEAVNTIGIMIKGLNPPEQQGYYPCDVADYGVIFNLSSSVFPRIIFWDNDIAHLSEQEFTNIMSTIETK